MRGKYRDANFHLTHSSLLASVAVILQAGKPYSNLYINNTKYKNNKHSRIQKQYVNVCMSTNILSDE